MGEVPVLVHGNKVFSQSGAILQYLVRLTGMLGAQNPDEEIEILRWLLWDNYKLSSLCGVTRFLSNFVPEEKRPREVIQWHISRLRLSFGVLDDVLSRRDWLVGDRPTIADMSCCGYLYYPEPFGFHVSDWPHIGAWLDRIMQLDGWQPPYALMPGCPADRNEHTP